MTSDGHDGSVGAHGVRPYMVFLAREGVGANGCSPLRDFWGLSLRVEVAAETVPRPRTEKGDCFAAFRGSQ